MLPLLESWPALAGAVRRAPSLALFLDFDGTLAPLVPHPEDAAADRATRAALLRLASNPRIKVWVISGRRRADLRARLAVPNVRYLGVLGWDDGTSLPPETQRLVEQARRSIVSRLNGTAGVQVENKGVSFALHYRGAPPQSVQQAGRILQEVVGGSDGALRAVPGDLVWEVLPREIQGKGHAVRKLWRASGPGALPIYIGNDQTDEPAFSVLARGITARVGHAAPSRARYFLRNPREVRRFLEELLR